MCGMIMRDFVDISRTILGACSLIILFLSNGLVSILTNMYNNIFIDKYIFIYCISTGTTYCAYESLQYLWYIVLIFNKHIAAVQTLIEYALRYPLFMYV